MSEADPRVIAIDNQTVPCAALPLLFKAAQELRGSEHTKNSPERACTSTDLAVLGHKELAAKLPFFLRLWWLREYTGSEYFITWANAMFTSPMGSQYSDPLCDASSADVPI